MGVIRLLPKDTVDKIAAGEVVVNASSVIKELLENAIDAKSKNIIVLTKHGGKNLIRVIDDGCGIMREDIPLAFTRNATSKIYDDISSISSLGFRGEALSSISFVSNITVATRHQSEAVGTKCEIYNNEIGTYHDIACNVGTTIEVRDLFFNFPARLKHLGTDSSETKDIIDITGKVALSHTDISVTLVCDERTIFSTSGNGDLKACVSSVLGRSKSDGLMPIQFENEPLYVSGLISSPNYINNKNSEHIVFLNGRYIQCPAITKAIDSVYMEYCGKTGADYILYINLPYNMIDVNIHPSKTTVRFLNESLIMLLIKQGIKDCLKDIFTLKEIIPKHIEEKHFDNSFADENKINHAETIESDSAKPNYQIKSDFAKPSVEEPKSVQEKLNILPFEETDKDDILQINETFDEAYSVIKKQDIAYKINKDIFLELTQMNYIGNAFMLYALIEGKDDLYAMDTHAAHERVLYEKYLCDYNSSKIPVQELMIPIVVSFTPNQYLIALNNVQTFEQLGFSIEDFSDNSIIVRSIPAYLNSDDIKEKISEMVNQIDKFDYTYKDLQSRNEVLIKNACHSAVRGRENISKDSVMYLLKELYKCEMPFTCPHGRPIIGKLNEKYFMKVFERIK